MQKSKKEETARLKDIRKMFLEALDEVVDGTAEGETKSTADGGVKASYQENKISKGMSDEERANILKVFR